MVFNCSCFLSQLQSKRLLYQSISALPNQSPGKDISVWGQHNICQLDPLSLLLSANTAPSQKLSEALRCLLLSCCFFCFPFKKVVHTPRNDKNPHLPFLSLSAAHCGTVTAGKLRIKVGLKSESPDMKTDLNYAFTDNDPRGNMQQRLSYSTYFVSIIRLHCSHSF